ncbi:MAG: hypothetical protein IMW89_20945 [Ktedonobacteraceae bacterium]|nr:hypothetical protein [Ktedonobacteraceae bacterium]
MDTTRVRRRVRPHIQPIQHDAIEDSDELYQTRMPSSARRYRTAPPEPADVLDESETPTSIPVQRRRASRTAVPPVHRRGTGTTANTGDIAPDTLKTAIISDTAITSRTEALAGLPARPTLAEPASRRLTRRFPLVSVVIGMVIMVIAIMALSALLSWWQGYQDDLRYGNPRTYQFDAVVGHGDSPANPTHFILINLRRHIQIIEIPGGDAAKARIYTGPVLLGEGQELTPVTGEIRDNNGRKDLVIHLRNQQIVFVNDGKTFHIQQ